MFWGITLDAGKRYTQTVEKSFHLSMAALGFNNAADPVTVMVEVEKAQFALCTLQSGKIPQQPLDIAFTEGEEITFFTEGNNEVHLTGYLVEEPETIEIDESEDFSMDSEESASVSEDNESDSEYEPQTLQRLLVGGNVDDEDEPSDDDWDPAKDNPTPKPKTRNSKKSLRNKKNQAHNEEETVSNGIAVQTHDGLAAASVTDAHIVSDEESQDCVPAKKAEVIQTEKKVNSKRGKKRKLKASNVANISPQKNGAAKNKRLKKRTAKASNDS